MSHVLHPAEIRVARRTHSTTSRFVETVISKTDPSASVGVVLEAEGEQSDEARSGGPFRETATAGFDSRGERERRQREHDGRDERRRVEQLDQFGVDEPAGQ